MEHKTL